MLYRQGCEHEGKICGCAAVKGGSGILGTAQILGGQIQGHTEQS